MEDVVIRPLVEGDFEQFVQLQQEALQHAPEAFGFDYEWYRELSLVDKEQEFEALLNYPYNYLLGLFVGGRLVGIVGFHCEHTKPKLRHKGRIWGMYITPEHRGRGLGTRLLQHLLAAAREDAGCEQVLLSVATTNHAAYGLYLKLGFLRYGTEYRALKLGTVYVDEHLMMRLL
jgi:ribosomal protein S18 acetylase RimI-like enzyme